MGFFAKWGIIGALLFAAVSVSLMHARGYFAIGGEIMFLFLPGFAVIAKAIREDLNCL